ncbi:peptidase inhibitor family I36 protein, partial [Streptomyces sp. WELS2]|uniref:peptidase inhibitor family I36 protein n=1 Tax=Streptomyces sp. WELS2 TaxID=2749435 RepID=UPI0015F04F1C
MYLKRSVFAGLLALAAAGSGLALSTTASAASAAPAAVSCSPGYACLYYHPDYTGAVYKQYYDDPNYGDDYFVTSTAPRGSEGAGQVVAGHTGSVDNWNCDSSITIYYSPGYAGIHQTIVACGKANLNSSLRNNIASGKFG